MFIKYYYILNEINTELSTTYELTSKLLEKYKKDKQNILIVLNSFKKLNLIIIIFLKIKISYL